MIKAILFDFGDVFINLDKQATSTRLKEMGVEQLSENLLLKNEDYEQGFITSDELSENYRHEFPDLDSTDFIDSWNAILLDFPKYRFKFIQKLAREKDFKLLLLSNTNETHINYIKENYPFYEDFKACFDGFYLSHEIGMRKPNPEIFEYVLKNHELKAENCLFIDDTKEHILSAKSLGFKTWKM